MNVGVELLVVHGVWLNVGWVYWSPVFTPSTKRDVEFDFCTKHG